MSDEFGFTRELTSEEKKTTIQAGERLIREEYRRRRCKVEQKYTKMHLPFCKFCADDDFENNVSKYIIDMKRKGVVVDIRDVKLVDKLCPDFDLYGKKHDFTLLDESEWNDMRIVGNVKKNELIGYMQNFVCTRYNDRGEGRIQFGHITVCVPLDVWEERKGIVVEETGDVPKRGRKRKI